MSTGERQALRAVDFSILTEDGRLIIRTQDADQVIDKFRVEKRDGTLIDLVGLGTELAFEDGDKLTFGDDDDVALLYDAGLDAFVLQDEGADLDLLQASADGSQTITLPGDLTVQGTTTEVDDILVTDVIVEDANGNDQFHIDGDAATPHLDAHGNELRNVGAFDATSVDTESVAITESVLRISPTGIATYAVDATGVANAFSDAGVGDGIIIPGTPIDMGTTPLTLPDNGRLLGMNKRETALTWNEGVGDALTVGAHAYVENIRLVGPNSSTSTDQGIVGTPNEGSGRFINVVLQNWARAVFLDAHFNTVWYSPVISGTTGDQASLSGKGGCMVFDTPSGSNNNSRVIAPYFSNNVEGPCMSLANEVSVIGYQGEANEAGAIKSIGSGNFIIGTRIENLKGGDGIVIDFGTCIVMGFDGAASGSNQTAIVSSTGTDEGKVAGPFHFSGWSSNFSGFQAATSVEQRNSS